MKSSLLRLFLVGAAASLLCACGGNQSLPPPAVDSAAIAGDGSTLLPQHTCHWYVHHGLPEPSSCGCPATPTPQPSATPLATPVPTPTAVAVPTVKPTPRASPTLLPTASPLSSRTVASAGTLGLTNAFVADLSL